jgi:histone deacetylase complex regulatory component SIN3
MKKEMSPEEYKQTMFTASTLYNSRLSHNQFEKALRDTGSEQVIFQHTIKGERLIDSTDLVIADGMTKGAYNELFTKVEKQGDYWVEYCNIHDHEMAKLILNNVDNIPDDQLFKQ